MHKKSLELKNPKFKKSREFKKETAIVDKKLSKVVKIVGIGKKSPNYKILKHKTCRIEKSLKLKNIKIETITNWKIEKSCQN